MIKRVISGGQIGVDQSGLRAAKNNGIPTGGTAPKGYKTAMGKNPALLKDEFGLKESKSEKYPIRTAQNVINSDGTLIIANNPTSPGSKLTADLTRKYNKPLLVIDLQQPNRHPSEISIKIRNWLHTKNIQILNVAGNRDKNSGDIAYRMLMIVFNKLSKRS